MTLSIRPKWGNIGANLVILALLGWVETKGVEEFTSGRMWSSNTTLYNFSVMITVTSIIGLVIVGGLVKAFKSFQIRIIKEESEEPHSSVSVQSQ